MPVTYSGLAIEERSKLGPPAVRSFSGTSSNVFRWYLIKLAMVDRGPTSLALGHPCRLPFLSRLEVLGWQSCTRCSTWKFPWETANFSEENRLMSRGKRRTKKRSVMMLVAKEKEKAKAKAKAMEMEGRTLEICLISRTRQSRYNESRTSAAQRE